MEKNDIKVSVIIPMYNDEKYLRRCIDSMLNQTLKDIEIIVIDDASTDKTWKMLNLYYAGVHKIKKIRNKNNIGTSESRNIGIEVARGKYLTWVDHDDFAQPNYLEVMYNNAEAHNADVSACGVRISVENQGEGAYVSRNLLLTSNEQILEEMSKFNVDTATWGKIVRADIIKKYNLRFSNTVMEDIFFWFSVFCHTNKYVSVEAMLYTWNFNSGSQSFIVGNYERNIDNFISVVERAKTVVNTVDVSNEIKDKLIVFLIETAVYTMHKYMYEKWDDFSVHILNKLKLSFGENAYQIYTLFSMYRNMRVDKYPQ